LDARPDEKGFDTLVKVVRNSIESAAAQDESEFAESKRTHIRLRNESFPEQVRELNLTEAVFAGRASDCHLQLDDLSVSRRQFKLFLSEGCVMVENISESNVTLLNGEPINEPTVLNVGDKLGCGRVTLVAEQG
jgi:pSer/pThr/pTyr-binding forkhead associated (FHA) protein